MSGVEWGRARDLFAWQKAIAGSDLPDAVKVTAMLVVHGGTGVSGRDVVINISRLAVDRAVSERTVWRHVKALTGTWLLQTVRPSQGSRGEPGRRARYDCCVPLAAVTGDRSSDTTDRERGRRSMVDHLTDPGGSCDKTEHDRGTVPAFDSPALLVGAATSSSACDCPPSHDLRMLTAETARLNSYFEARHLDDQFTIEQVHLFLDTAHSSGPVIHVHAFVDSVMESMSPEQLWNWVHDLTYALTVENA